MGLRDTKNDDSRKDHTTTTSTPVELEVVNLVHSENPFVAFKLEVSETQPPFLAATASPPFPLKGFCVRPLLLFEYTKEQNEGEGGEKENSRSIAKKTACLTGGCRLRPTEKDPKEGSA